MGFLYTARDRYQVIRPLNAQSTAGNRVYLATGSAGRRCVIKIAGVGNDQFPRWLIDASFENEARILAALSTPNIPQLIESCVLDGRPALITSWVDGVDICDWSSTAGVEGVAWACEETMQLLAQIHQQGYVHNDIHAFNVLVSPAGVGLIDFGLAVPIGTVFLQPGMCPPGTDECDLPLPVTSLGRAAYDLERADALFRVAQLSASSGKTMQVIEREAADCAFERWKDQQYGK